MLDCIEGDTCVADVSAEFIRLVVVTVSLLFVAFDPFFFIMSVVRVVAIVVIAVVVFCCWWSVSYNDMIIKNIQKRIN
ncbi:hypothetical protein BCR42DRAFT_416109 [Absidia repens]|uniref:Uncharacterized protein n=1 Tax=Absidia repens TaxID=90262 RepID=A0A1X2IHS2_9FUNG|nr:hypothetical protein BCR42DRAFT_416109 [Absidia repens]